MFVCASFFEWQTVGKEKQPFANGLHHSKVLGFAGLYNTWHDESGNEIQNCAILTTEPNSFMAPIHDRMPVILDVSGVRTWLDPEVTVKEILQALLVPFPASKMTTYPVSKMVGIVRNETPEVH
jgi:putative SOS response-associated peptidase YedK